MTYGSAKPLKSIGFRPCRQQKQVSISLLLFDVSLHPDYNHEDGERNVTAGTAILYTNRETNPGKVIKTIIIIKLREEVKYVTWNVSLE